MKKSTKAKRGTTTKKASRGKRQNVPRAAAVDEGESLWSAADMAEKVAELLGIPLDRMTSFEIAESNDEFVRKYRWHMKIGLRR